MFSFLRRLPDGQRTLLVLRRGSDRGSQEVKNRKRRVSTMQADSSHAREPWSRRWSRRRARRDRPHYDKILLDVDDDAGDRLFDRQPVGIDGQLGGLRRLVGCGDAGELRDLPAARLLVEALGVALLA